MMVWAAFRFSVALPRSIWPFSDCSECCYLIWHHRTTPSSILLCASTAIHMMVGPRLPAGHQSGTPRTTAASLPRCTPTRCPRRCCRSHHPHGGISIDVNPESASRVPVPPTRDLAIRVVRLPPAHRGPPHVQPVSTTQQLRLVQQLRHPTALHCSL